LTTTAAVTRNGDVLSYASAFDVAQGSALCSCKSTSPINTSNIYLLSGDSSGRLLYLNAANARTECLTYDGTTVAQITGGPSLNTGIRKQATRWGTDILISVNGILNTTALFDGSMGSSTTLSIAAGPGGIKQLSGTIREVHIWPTPLTDVQLQQVTR
jgi:hypothetical protein